MVTNIFKVFLISVIIFCWGCAEPSMEYMTYGHQQDYIRQTTYGPYYTINRYSYSSYPLISPYYYHNSPYARHPSTYNNCLQTNRLYWYCY
uniref:Uncharacterized protein n=1 Tax=Candidatus Berkiella cookevillensis TaxID=437022 RepID=A0A0Q9YPA6_9GAMM